MGSLGNYLRELRESKGASLEEIARATRVGRRHLEALEDEDFKELPAPVFVKGFIRAYCEFLEIRPDQALSRYRDMLGEPAITPGSMAPGRARPSWQLTPVAVSLVLLVVLAGGLLAVNLGLRSGGGPGVAPKPAAEAPPAPAPAPSAEGQGRASAPPVTGAVPAPGPIPAQEAPAPRAEAPVPPAPAPEPAAPRAGQRLVVKAIEPTWIRVQTDRGTAVEELLPAGAVREWSTEKRFLITVGNAGGLEVTLNGQRLPPLGDRGAVIRELILPQETPRS